MSIEQTRDPVPATEALRGNYNRLDSPGELIASTQALTEPEVDAGLEADAD